MELPSIQFTVEVESEGKLRPVPECLRALQRDPNGSILTNVYRKATHMYRPLS